MFYGIKPGSWRILVAIYNALLLYTPAWKKFPKHIIIPNGDESHTSNVQRSTHKNTPIWGNTKIVGKHQEPLGCLTPQLNTHFKSCHLGWYPHGHLECCLGCLDLWPFLICFKFAKFGSIFLAFVLHWHWGWHWGCNLNSRVNLRECNDYPLAN